MDKKIKEDIIRHSDDMISQQYVYRDVFVFQRTLKHGIWFVTYKNHIITYGQYRNDLQEWIDTNYIIN